MTTRVENTLIHFPEWYDERGEWEAETKGWLQGVQVEFPKGQLYPLFFYDPVRLAQDLEAEDAMGVVAEPGMVVIAELTRSNIVRAVEKLIFANYFERLKPICLAVANGVGH